MFEKKWLEEIVASINLLNPEYMVNALKDIESYIKAYLWTFPILVLYEEPVGW